MNLGRIASPQSNHAFDQVDAHQSTSTNPTKKQFTAARITKKFDIATTGQAELLTVRVLNENRRISESQAVSEEEMDELAMMFQRIHISQGPFRN